MFCAIYSTEVQGSTELQITCDCLH